MARETFPELRHLERGDEAVLSRVAEEVFDVPVHRERVRLFLSEPTYHLIVAVHEDEVVGQIMAFIRCLACVLATSWAKCAPRTCASPLRKPLTFSNERWV